MHYFEGLNTEELNCLISDPLNVISPLKFYNLKLEDLNKIPILKQVKIFGEIIERNKEIKLTTRGNLPIKIVKELYEKGPIKDEFVESGISKIYKEEDCKIVHLTHLISQLIPIIKKNNNKISLSKNGDKLLNNDIELYPKLLNTLAQKFNLGYFDGFECENTGQIGLLFTLYLINKYGDKEQTPKFYCNKYKNIFPELYDQYIDFAGRSKEESFESCYSLRSFERSLNYFGIIEIKKEPMSNIKSIRKTNLFDKVVKFQFRLPLTITN